MLRDTVGVTNHSILGTVTQYHKQKALQDAKDADKENDDISLKLPPIFKNKKRKSSTDMMIKKEQQRQSAIHKALSSPRISSLFSPKTKSSRSRYQSNTSALRRGQKIEKNKENRKLQQLLKGDRIYATREERVLKKWEQQQKEWKNLKKNIAQKVGKTEDELVITRAEEWREMIEEIDLMTKSIPASHLASNHWQYSLRKKTGNEETTHMVPIGNMFSGLYCKVSDKKKPLKETVRKPRSLPVVLNDKSMSDNHYNLPGKGGASKHWRERSVTYQFRKKLHKRMTQMKPNNLDQLDGLEIVGYNMFKLEKLELPSYSYEKLAKKEEANDTKCILRDDESEYLDDESYEVIDDKDVPIIGPFVEFEPSNAIMFKSILHQELTKVLTIKNTGTTAMLLRLENVEQSFVKFIYLKDNAMFLYPTEQFSILPGCTKSIAFYFKPSKPGSYHLVIGIDASPSIKQKQVELQGICMMEDEDKIHREAFINKVKDEQIQEDVGSVIKNMIQNIPESDSDFENLPRLFCQRNKDHKLYWYPEILNELRALSESIISKFRRRKRKTYCWDLSVSTLKSWLDELKNIQESSVVESLRISLLELIEQAQQIPPTNPIYEDLCSTLINDLTLQMPRIVWNAKQFAQSSHESDEKDKEEEIENKDQETEEDTEETITLSTTEWNVFESDHYKNKLYQDCKAYFCQIIDQFENGIIDESRIDESITKPIKSKLNPKPQQIITFGSWVDDRSKSTDSSEKATETTEEEVNESSSPNIECADIECLFDRCIGSIHSNSEITIMTSPYKTWMCTNKQSFKSIQEPKSETDTDRKEEDETETITQETETEDDEEPKSVLDDFDLLPIFKGFNIAQVFCCKNMISLLTDRGDVYCSLFEDLELHQKRILCDKNITKITGCVSTNKCVAISGCGEVFEWNMITETLDDETEETEVVEKEKDAENVSDENEDNSDSYSIINSICDAKQLIDIDQKIIDIAITSTANAAITNDGKLIIWGDYDKIYSENDDSANDKNKKKTNKTKKKKKKEEEEEEHDKPAKSYIFIECKQQSIENEEENEENVPVSKYKSIASCTNCFVVLDEDGNVHSFGIDEFGALGLGKDMNESLQPRLVTFDNDSQIKILSISSCIHSCAAIDKESNVWFWGKRISQNEDEKEDKEEDTIGMDAYFTPNKITIKSQNNLIKKVLVTNVGGFLWA